MDILPAHRPVPVLATITVDGRDYDVYRVGVCQGGQKCTLCGPGHWWNVWGIQPHHTAAERDLPEPMRPRMAHAYASPIRPHAGSRRVGHPEAPMDDGWQIHDEMNREVFGYADATTFEEIVAIAAKGLDLPH